jgi:hypothetical protein
MISSLAALQIRNYTKGQIFVSQNSFDNETGKHDNQEN